MKNKKKVLGLLICAVLLVVGSVMGTMAWLTSQDAVTNTFTVGNVKITLDELDVDNDENATDNKTYTEGFYANTTRDKANEYKLMPGKTYVKDPTVHVDGGSDYSWLFVKVDNGIEAIEADGDASIEAQMLAKDFVLIDAANNVYAYKHIVGPNQSITVFDTFTIADGVDNDTLAANKDNVIKVTAYAIQAEGFTTYDAAWTEGSAEWFPAAQ